MKMFAFLGLGAAAVLVLGACGGDDDDAQDADASVSPAAAADGTLALGGTAELNNGVRVAVLSVQPAGALAGREAAAGEELVFVRVRVENRDDETQPPPDLKLQCSNGQGASYVFEGAGALERDDLPAGSQDEGVRLFSKPANCADGHVEANATGRITTEKKTARWQLP